MAKFYGSVFNAAKTGTGPQATPASGFANGKRRSHTEIFTLAGQASGSLLYVGTLPPGAVFEGIVLTTDTSLGTAQVECGSEASSAKYAAAAVLTATDTPTIRGKASGMAQTPPTSPEEVWLKTSAAALPGAGTLVTELRYKTAA